MPKNDFGLEEYKALHGQVEELSLRDVHLARILNGLLLQVAHLSGLDAEQELAKEEEEARKEEERAHQQTLKEEERTQRQARAKEGK